MGLFFSIPYGERCLEKIVKDGALFSDVLGKLQEIAARVTGSFITVVQNRKPNGMASFQPVDDVCG